MASRFKKYCPQCLEVKPGQIEKCPSCGGKLLKLPADDLTGTVLDNQYKIVGKLGEGGMGIVYKAKQEYIDRFVAIKLLRKDLASDEIAVKRFFLEARAAARLKNPHTVTIHAFGATDQGRLYFVMELLEGYSLAAIIRREEVLDWTRAIQLTLQACDSLAEAHAGKIWHRDLKPENLFVVQDDAGREFVKVLDFGIAKVVQGEGESLTKTGMVCGTPQYLSPEQGAGKKVDQRSDIYSLAVVLYEMLAGRPPFVGETPIAILMQHINEDPRPISETNPEAKVPVRLNRLILRTLAKDPEERPQTIRELAEEFAQILADEASAGETEKLIGVTTTASGVRVATAAFNAEEAARIARHTTEDSAADREPPRPPAGDSSAFTALPEGLDAPEIEQAPGRGRALVWAGIAALVVAAVAVLAFSGMFGKGRQVDEQPSPAGSEQPAGAPAPEESGPVLPIAPPARTPDVQARGVLLPEVATEPLQVVDAAQEPSPADATAEQAAPEIVPASPRADVVTDDAPVPLGQDLHARPPQYPERERRAFPAPPQPGPKAVYKKEKKKKKERKEEPAPPHEKTLTPAPVETKTGDKEQEEEKEQTEAKAEKKPDVTKEFEQIPAPVESEFELVPPK